jgi:aminoglycoside phosphotransferase (APT) family kinase protein
VTIDPDLPSLTRTPVAEYNIDGALVRRLLSEQHADLAHLPVQPVDSGFDNAMFRLGDSLGVRMPRRSIAAPLIVHEQKWLPEIAPRLTLPVPVPTRFGIPSADYPCRWSVVPWLPGRCADQEEINASEAPRLADFLRSLHIAAPENAPVNHLRGCPLQQRTAAVESRMHRLSRVTDFVTPRLIQAWNEALAAPLDMPPAWIHGDLYSRNVLVKRGVVSGIIDWGDMTSGDPATDLACVWSLFSNSSSREFFVAYGSVSEVTIKRAKGWAISFGVMLLDTGLADNPRNARIGERILHRI